MDVSVFVSSTCRDMEPDCRPAVLDAIKSADDMLREDADGSASAVAMETWDTDWEPAVQLCQQKIREQSTHYLGLLGYLRGFVPPPAGQGAASITEIELGCAARHCGPQRMAIFVPKAHTGIAAELERRAEELQGDAERDAQRAFLAQVLHDGAAQQFDTPSNLALRVTRTVRRWARGGIRGTARAAQVTTDAAARRRVPGDRDRITIGRQPQLTAFLDVLGAISVPGVKKAAAFLVHGSVGSGHPELMTRLAEDESFRDPRRYMISADALWMESSPAGLMEAMAREIQDGWKPADLRELAAGLAEILGERDVIWQVSSLEGYHGGPAAFMAEFWRPLVDEVPQDTPNRLICLASAETADLTADTSWPGQGTLDAEPYAGYVHVLPPLLPFTAAELSLWLRARMTPAKADYWTGKLMDRSKGAPGALYAFLAHPALWDQQADPAAAGSSPTRSLV